MTTLLRCALGLRVLSLVFVALALAALLRRPGLPAAGDYQLGPVSLSAGQAPGMADVPLIVHYNIFSPSRRAPSNRYRPFATESEATPPARSDATTDSPSAARDGVPQFFGTVTGPRGTFALLRLDASSPDAQLYREGDVAFGYSVVTINEQSVILSSARGRIELRLIRPGGPPS